MSKKFTVKQTSSGKYSVVDNETNKSVSYNLGKKNKKEKIDDTYEKVAGKETIKKNLEKFF